MFHSWWMLAISVFADMYIHACFHTELGHCGTVSHMGLWSISGGYYCTRLQHCRNCYSVRGVWLSADKSTHQMLCLAWRHTGHESEHYIQSPGFAKTEILLEIHLSNVGKRPGRRHTVMWSSSPIQRSISLPVFNYEAWANIVLSVRIKEYIHVFTAPWWHRMTLSSLNSWAKQFGYKWTSLKILRWSAARLADFENLMNGLGPTLSNVEMFVKIA